MLGNLEASVKVWTARGCMLPRMQYSREARIHSVGPNFDHLRLFYIVNHYFLFYSCGCMLPWSTESTEWVEWPGSMLPMWR
jgi:hypothetical protein